MFARGMTWALLLLAACVQPSSVTCPDGSVCPAGTECASFNTISLCIDPAQREACTGRRELAPCEVAGLLGTCRDGVCLPIGCGNQRVDDPIFGTGEQCDDGNRASHDGCSSTCQLEIPRIRKLGVEREQSGVGEHAMAFDGERGTLTMFGGASYGGARREEQFSELTSERSKDQWAVRNPIVTPSGRIGHAVAYDFARRRIVLFGGKTIGLSGDTWEWNGAEWTEMQPEHAPQPRTDHAMAHDPIRRTTVLYGGRTATGALGDTWEWNGVDWTERVLAVSPPALADHAMVFDPARGVIVLVGSAGDRVQTWEYDGAWREVTTQAAPPSGVGAALGYDGVDRAVIQVGGAGADTTSGTWRFDGIGWSMVPSNTPDALIEHAVGLEPTTGRMLVHGGYLSSGTPSNTTTRWDGTAWVVVEERPVVNPVCSDAVMALDARRRRVVAFCRNALVGETWELGEDGWRLGATTGPPPRTGAAMAYDHVRQQIVLFGGEPAGGGADDQTWIWDGTSWTPHASAIRPTPRRDAMMAFDGEHVLLVGGVVLENGQPTDETWLWDGASWTRTPDDTPFFPLSSAAMAYDPIRDRVLLHGGFTLGFREELYAWDRGAQRWTLLPAPLLRPASQAGGALVWDSARGRLVLIGGENTAGPVHEIWEWDGAGWVEVLAFVDASRVVAAESFDGAGILFSPTDLFDVSVLRWQVATEYDTCRGGDHDRDGLGGCDDPDCWYRCAPMCWPGTVCDASEPQCGDGTCDALLEDCRVCPTDCGTCPVVCGDFVCSPGEACVGDCPS